MRHVQTSSSSTSTWHISSVCPGLSPVVKVTSWWCNMGQWERYTFVSFPLLYDNVMWWFCSHRCRSYIWPSRDNDSMVLSILVSLLPTKSEPIITVGSCVDILCDSSRLVSGFYILYHRVLSDLTLSYLILPYFSWSLSYLILSYLILSYLI